MIKITASDRVDAIAQEWAATLHVFLTEKLVGNNRVYVILPGKSRLYFPSRWRKYLYDFNLCCPSKVSRQQRRVAVRLLLDVFSLEANLIGRKAEVNRLKTVCEQLKINSPVVFDQIKNICVRIYEDFTLKNAYAFLSKLNIRTCPYCNRHYTFTIEKDQKGDFCSRGEFDHFLDKSDYPLLAVSFYNLVPSCHECNHGKGVKDVKVNPYEAGFSSRFQLQDPRSGKKLNANEMLGLKTIGDFNIGFENPSAEEQKNIETLGLIQLYNEHRDYALEMIEKYTAYDYATQRGLVDAFQGLFHSQSQIDDFIWGQYMHTAANQNRPLSKLTADILHILRKR